ncbi:MAG: alpha/beta fold hydrolase [Acutalibacteraceae bacterium]
MKKVLSILMALAMVLSLAAVPSSAAGNVAKKEFTYQSYDENYTIHAISWKPADGKIKGVIQFAHGVAEYIDRYDSMARWFVDQGYAVYGNDHVGHGQSVTKEHPLGDIGSKNENGQTFVEDCKTLTGIAKKENPGKPFFLFGHSMGSFIARRYAAQYGNELDGLILCGSGQIPAETCKKLGQGLTYIGMTQTDDKLDNAVKVLMGAAGSTDWLSVNQENRDKYEADPLCGFPLTVQSYGETIELLADASSPATIGKAPKDLPIFFISGSKDPVGLYGVGFNQAVAAYRKGHTKVSSKLYEGYKHEIHNDDCKLEVYQDILQFIQSNMK